MRDYTEIDNSRVWDYLSNGKEILAIKFCTNCFDADVIHLIVESVSYVNEIICDENILFFVKNEDLL